MDHKFLLFLVGLTIISHGSTGLRIKITKIVCNSTSPDFGHVDWCILKPESRYVQYVKLRYTVYKVPISNFKIHARIMKRLNGWKPFLYDITQECHTLKHLNKLTRFIWQHAKNVTNIRNLDCPQNQSMYEVERLDNKYIENGLQMLPIPSGDYAVFTTVLVNQTQIGQFNGYVTVF